jgi:hypothetical protein
LEDVRGGGRPRTAEAQRECQKQIDTHLAQLLLIKKQIRADDPMDAVQMYVFTATTNYFLG